MHNAFSESLFNPDAAIPKGLACWNQTDCHERFSVYRNNVMSSLINVLAGNFPVVEQLVGQRFFRAMAKEYVMQCPPDAPMMVKYGRSFAKFIHDFPPASSIPYLADIAQLEFAIQESRHAADVRAIELSKLINLIEDQNKLNSTGLFLAPATQLVISAFPVASIWLAHQPQSEIQLNTIALDHAENVLLTRPQLNVDIDRVESGMALFINSLLKGLSVTQAAELASERSFEPVETLQLLIKQDAIIDLIDLPCEGAIT